MAAVEALIGVPKRARPPTPTGFPTTATAIGIQPGASGLSIAAPYGLSDLFGLIVRPNKVQITRAIYEAKVARWRSFWPGLTVIDW